MTRKGWITAGVLAAFLVAGAFAARPDDDPAGVRGTLALRRFLLNMGLEVKEGATPPRLRPGLGAGRAGTFVLLDDKRDRQGAREILRWVSAGGRLVLADPSSPIARALRVRAASTIAPLGGKETLQSGCSEFRRAQVSRIEVSGSDRAFSQAPGGAVGCFRAGRGSYLLSFPHGRGSVVLIGGKSAFSNEFLLESDNAVFAFRLLAGFGPVVFGPPASPSMFGTAKGPWESLPPLGKAGVVQIVIAGGIFLFVKGRRFGRPVLEEPVSPIPSSQLVWAAAGLYRMAGAAEFAGRLLRQGARRRLTRRLGVPVGDEATLRRALDRFPALDPEQAARALDGPDPAGDADLIELALELDRLERTVTGEPV